MEQRGRVRRKGETLSHGHQQEGFIVRALDHEFYAA